MGLKTLCEEMNIDFGGGKGKVNHAILPREFQTKTVIQLKIGDECYINPKALWIDEYSKCWISLEAEQIGKPVENIFEEELLLVKRTENGYEVTMSKDINYTWRKTPSRDYIAYQSIMEDQCDTLIYKLHII